MFIIALKELLDAYPPLKMTISLVAMIAIYRLPEIITAIRWW